MTGPRAATLAAAINESNERRDLLQTEVEEASRECGGAALRLAMLCRTGGADPAMLERAAREVLDVAGRLAGAAHLLLTTP